MSWDYSILTLLHSEKKILIYKEDIRGDILKIRYILWSSIFLIKKEKKIYVNKLNKINYEQIFSKIFYADTYKY